MPLGDGRTEGSATAVAVQAQRRLCMPLGQMLPMPGVLRTYVKVIVRFVAQAGVAIMRSGRRGAFVTVA